MNALRKNLCTRVTKFFHIDSIGTLQQCSTHQHYNEVLLFFLKGTINQKGQIFKKVLSNFLARTLKCKKNSKKLNFCP